MTLLRSYKSYLFLLALAGAAFATHKFFPRREPEQTQDFFIRRGDLIQRVTMSGIITPKRKSLVYAPYKGFIAKLFVDIGDKVNTGDPLVIVTETAKPQGEQFPLRASISGTVVQIEKMVGEPVRAEQDLKEYILRIDDLSSMRVLATTTELDRVKIKSGMEVSIRVVPILGKTYRGKIETLDLAARESDPNSWGNKGRVEFQVKASIEDADDKIRSGMGVIMDVITAKKTNTLLVAHPFVSRKDGKYFITKKDGSMKEITIGLQNEDDLEVLSGVTEKESLAMPRLDQRKG